MTINERVAWIHNEATTLTTTDLVELKYRLDGMIEEATEIRGLVSDKLRRQRKGKNRKEAKRRATGQGMP